MPENSAAVLILLEILTRTFGTLGHAMHAGMTGFICYQWIKARSRWEIEQARNWTMKGTFLIATYSGMALTGPILAEAYGTSIDTPKLVMMTPAYIGVIAAFSTRDPATHTVTWAAALLGAVAVISTAPTPGEGSIRVMTSVGTVILGAHTAIVLTARIYQQGLAMRTGPATAATLLGMDAGAAAYLMATALAQPG